MITHPFESVHIGQSFFLNCFIGIVYIGLCSEIDNLNASNMLRGCRCDTIPTLFNYACCITDVWWVAVYANPAQPSGK